MTRATAHIDLWEIRPLVEKGMEAVGRSYKFFSLDRKDPDCYTIRCCHPDVTPGLSEQFAAIGLGIGMRP